MKIKIKKLNENAKIPTYATEFAAGCDLYACIDEDVTIEKGEIRKIHTGIAVCPESDDVVLLIYGRSGLGTKFGITLANCVGVVDSDYRGEIIVSLINAGKEPFTVHNGDRIAQLVVTPVIRAEFEESETLPESQRGENGFGSTGIK